MLTTGQIARQAALSEKAVRLYTDQGLLTARRDGASRRMFDVDQLERARRIALLRSLGISLAEVGSVLDADDPARTFDGLWASRRSNAAAAERAGEYARGVLSGASALPDRLVVQSRDLPERAVMRVNGEATLPQFTSVLPELTMRVLTALKDADAPLAAPIYVEISTRATETFPAKLHVCAPFEGTIRPRSGTELIVDGTHTELFVGLTQEQADDQQLVVAVHDYMTRHHGDVRVGPNREVYHPAFGSGADGVVMEIALPHPLDPH